MQLNPVIAPPVAKPQPPITPAAQMAMSPAVQAAQQTTATVRTQTLQAPQAVGKAENPRDTRNATQTGQALDTQAAAANARTNGQGYGARTRGSLLDVSV
ncbi:hypothetical protein [Azospirillum canadense]|uniref:hypothetical protein n=1 Tax=Azospirillum canadense TaxID=403962 RepID=UPI002226A27D|nr:hypothetical protein [Azospirillum canadense]MCW2237016.1 putative membrane protein [Azospirillum canadense]